MKNLRRLKNLSLVFFLFPCFQLHCFGGWAEDALRKEADYLVDCAWTSYAQNGSNANDSDDAHGALNNVRINSADGASWVQPREAAIGMIGLMGAARRLHWAGEDISVYRYVSDRFFDVWLRARKEPIYTSNGSNKGGFYFRLSYDSNANQIEAISPTTASTASMVIAMWKRYEFLNDIGQSSAANQWLSQGWPIVKQACNFINKSYNSTYKMVQSSPQTSDMWISDTTLAACALKCAYRWKQLANKSTPFNYNSRAESIKIGIFNMKDPGGWKAFYAVRLASDNFNPSYGGAVDQLGFIPFESGLLSVSDNYAKQISDWWTNGGDGVKMTPHTTNSSDWRYYGVHWHYFTDTSDYDFLYPGPSLQLAKVERMISQDTSGTYTNSQKNEAQVRADRRYAFANNSSNLWFGEGNQSEANVPNGIVDWRDPTNYNNKAGSWERFIDTSAYMIQVTLQIIYNDDDFSIYLPN